ncbi:MAG: ATP-binding cassette domain-containing protein [Clostridiales bacterium]|nr:ATP-binding cassette domain-containing protein [Clostridiales bacterium]
MEQITVRNLTFSYEGENSDALSDISFTVNRGEIVLVVGESGCGKTTLLRHLKRDFSPQGRFSGEILFGGNRIREMSPRMQASKIGFVRQNVEAAQATDKVWHELAFGLESLNCPQDIMQRKVAEMTAFFGLEDVYNASLDTLSGGQKQMINLASVMIMEPELLVLDEPTSQLDPIAANDFFQMISKINREFGTTIIMTEHRLEEIFSLCDKVLVLEKGKLILEGSPKHVVRKLYDDKNRMYAAMPTAARLFLELEEEMAYGGEQWDKIPLTVREGATWFHHFCGEHGTEREECEAISSLEKDRGGKRQNKLSGNKSTAIVAKELWFRYERNGKDILKGLSLSLEKGKVTALLGGNGAGKSTLLHVLAGHEKAYDGKIRYESEPDSGTGGGRLMPASVGMLPQNPQAMFAKKTVLEELSCSCGQGDDTLSEIIKLFELTHLLYHHPYDLSGGEMQKLALAKLVLEDADILLLDEPGKGMDYAFKEEMGALLRKLAKSGKTILLVSHDVEFCARFADQCGLFFDGHIISLEESKNFFCQNVFYTTATRRICRECMKEAVVMEDVLHAFGGKTVKVRLEEENAIQSEERMIARETEKRMIDEGEMTAQEVRCLESYMAGMESEKAETCIAVEQPEEMKCIKSSEKLIKKTKHGLMTFLIFFLLMPATIYVGEVFLHQRKYYFISLLLVLEAIASFFFSFERRKPKIREIMVVATLCAITVAGRAAFYMVPNVKPMAALVILSGVSLGGEIGFLVGAFSMLVSNIFFGQGPWTPWQMFAMGILGFLAGVIFRKDMPLTKKKIIGLCVFGFLSVVIFYGGIMNPASVIMYQDNVNVEMIIAACGMGLPFDVIHGASTAVFLLIGAKPILEKLARVKKKYGFETEKGVQ